MRRYLLLILCLSFALSSLMGQSSVLPNKANDDISVIVNDSLMFIGQNVDSLTEEQRYFNPLYLIVQKGKEYLKKQLIRASVCDCDTTVPNRRIGIFSVAPNKHVSFSQGNLQYFPAANLWKFADNQYEHLGASNKYLSPTYRNWVDLFGWSGDSGKAPFGVSTSTDNADYAGEFLDWGTNPICGDAANTWRTLSKDEWDYLLNDRKNATSLIGIANINGINGLVILPDSWTCPAGVTFKSGFHSSCGVDYYAAYQTLTADQWSKLEKSGAIFLPAAGYRRGSDVYDVQNYGSYWFATEYNGYEANDLDFLSGVARIDTTSRYCGQSVRLVHDTIVPTPAPCETFTVNGVSFNMMCVEGGTFMMGAMEGDSTASKNEFPQHSVTLSNYMIGQTEITKAQWLAVMGDKPKSASSSWLTADLQTPANYVTWSECVEFADRLRQLTGHNFRLPTEAEWEFAARGGTLSRGYRYSGSNNLDEVGWYIHNRQQTTHPVATKLPNELGIYDMSGNVWEWCLDSPKDYKDYAQLDPLPAFVNNQRVIRGGAYEREAYRCTNTHRTTWLSAWSHKGANMGFRVVLNDEHIIRTILLPDSIAFNMKHINGGTFMMGQTEVTQALWKVVMGTTPENEYNSSTSGDALMQVGDNLPMAYLSWNDAQKFVERLNVMTGLYFRLPTEAEWIYAAKGGQRSKGYKYSGSDSLEEVAWCATNAKGEIKPVGLLKPNELGIYDMCGNVWEFCNDVQSDGKIVAHGCSSSESWSAAHYRPEYRYLLAKTYKANRLGLRLVMDTAKYIPTPCETFDVNGVKFNMMCVEGGTFTMGEGSGAHQVTLSDYKIAQTELTQGLWEAVMGQTYDEVLSKNGADIICLGPTHPAYALTWIDCQEFVNKLNQLTGLNFRMSTEAEWEFAARGGNRSRGYTYAGGNDLDAVAWHGLNSDNLLHPVAQKLPNELGIYDMTGNAWELCLDGYAAYATYSQTNPIIPVKGDVVARGGSSYNGWSDDIWLPTHRLNRSLFAPRTRNTLRLVLSDEVIVKTVVLDNNLTFNMIGVNSGTFMMGQTEVTQALWKAVMGTTLENEYNSSTSGDPLLQVGDNLPMAYLSWNDAQKFVERLNAMTGLYFRLPTEAEWIYAAKGGQRSKGYKYSGSDSLEEVAWCGTNANGAIKQVGLLKPNELGIYDMSGNVWEYCSDVLGTGEIFSHGGSSYPGWNETYSDLEYRNVRSKANKAGRLGLRLVMDTAKYIPTPCKTFEVNGVKFNMMCVEGGTMTIGAGDIMEYRRRPEHKTTISDFYIGQTQVTQELWQAVMGDNPSVFKSDTSSSHPVENVSVIDIQEFLTKLNAMTGVNFRLPTEAEWEYAARGGQKSKGFMYAGSDDRNQVAWYGVSDKNGGTTHPVAQKRPNELGLYDMHGNVWEWLHDKYTDIINVYPSVNPTGFISNLKASPVACGSAYYSDLGPSNAWGWVGVGSISTRSSWFGFRLALSDEDPFMAIDVNNYRFHMMLVKGGTFQMGAASTDATAIENERPAHQVTLSDYYVGQTEVTRALWKTVMGSLPDGGEADNKPITNVNYDECQTFITQLNDLTGRHFRLPTEAEWEFAARGGNQSKGYKYAGSNDVDSVAWWQETSGDTIHPVAQLMPNELGIYDMSGNVFEWCSDWYGDYASNAQINPQGAASGTQRVGRGGGYRAEDNRCRVTRRIPTDPEQRMTTLGLRLVLDKHAYVDLGLSVLWATTNLGATQPEEYGDYFAWGETDPKDIYTRDNYKWRDNTKYNNSGGLTSIQLEDDAAHVNWGGDWRMPTKEEYSELIEKCTWTWTQHKGINGYQVTGPNGNSIFLPATGYIGNGPSYPVGEYGLYWTTELHSSSINSSYILIFGKNYTQRPSPNGSRFYGFSIRPVIPTNREPLHPLSPAKRIGVFSVAKDKQVSFSQGNLQYIRSDNLWRFADNQYDYIGEDNIKDNQLANRIDLFGWSSNSSKVSWGISISDSIKDYMGDFVDWGVNIIHSDAVNTWRTLNHEEWKYLFCTRLHAQSLFGFGKVADVNGIIILPDDWKLPTGITFVPSVNKGFLWDNDKLQYKSNSNGFLHNTYTAEQWALMEQAGAVFLPATGCRYAANTYDVGNDGNYWASTHYDEYKTYLLDFYSNRLGPQDNYYLLYGFSVRLVHDTIVPFEPEYVDLGLSVMWATTNVGAEQPEAYGDYFAWGEVAPKDEYAWSTYKWSNSDGSILTKYNFNQSQGVVDNKYVLDPEDDAARMNWGGDWRMPTLE